MSENKRNRWNIPATLLALLLAAAPLPAAVAADLSNPAQVVDGYLASLASGDVDGILARIDGRMKTKNRALELSPATYSEFLKDHYNGVQTRVEDISPQGDKMRARVRFDYPTAASSIIEFILTREDGQWRITGEDY